MCIHFGSAVCDFLQSPSVSQGWNCSQANIKYALCSHCCLIHQLALKQICVFKTSIIAEPTLQVNSQRIPPSLVFRTLDCRLEDGRAYENGSFIYISYLLQNFR